MVDSSGRGVLTSKIGVWTSERIVARAPANSMLGYVTHPNVPATVRLKTFPFSKKRCLKSE